MMKTILSLAGLGIAGGIFFFFTQPQYDSVRAYQTQIEAYDQALDKAAELQQLKQSLLSRYSAFNPADLDRLQKLLPDHVDNVRLVLDLDSLAARHGMALQNVIISNPASEQGDQNAAGIIGRGRQKHDSLTLRFSTIGSYENFRAFLQDLDSSLRVVDLVSLQLEPDAGLLPEEGEEQRAEPLYAYDMTIRTYWLK